MWSIMGERANVNVLSCPYFDAGKKFATSTIRTSPTRPTVMTRVCGTPRHGSTAPKIAAAKKPTAPITNSSQASSGTP